MVCVVLANLKELWAGVFGELLLFRFCWGWIRYQTIDEQMSLISVCASSRLGAGVQTFESID